MANDLETLNALLSISDRIKQRRLQLKQFELSQKEFASREKQLKRQNDALDRISGGIGKAKELLANQGFNDLKYVYEHDEFQKIKNKLKPKDSELIEAIFSDRAKAIEGLGQDYYAKQLSYDINKGRIQASRGGRSLSFTDSLKNELRQSLLSISTIKNQDGLYPFAEDLSDADLFELLEKKTFKGIAVNDLNLDQETKQRLSENLLRVSTAKSILGESLTNLQTKQRSKELELETKELSRKMKLIDLNLKKSGYQVDEIKAINTVTNEAFKELEEADLTPGDIVKVIKVLTDGSVTDYDRILEHLSKGDVDVDEDFLKGLDDESKAFFKLFNDRDLEEEEINVLVKYISNLASLQKVSSKNKRLRDTGSGTSFRK